VDSETDGSPLSKSMRYTQRVTHLSNEPAFFQSYTMQSIPQMLSSSGWVRTPHSPT
jgi:hypothetical protein